MLFAHRDHRSSRAALFDDMDSLEEGGLRSSSSYSSGIDDHDNEKTMDTLHDRASFLKRVRTPLSQLPPPIGKQKYFSLLAFLSYIKKLARLTFNLEK